MASDSARWPRAGWLVTERKQAAIERVFAHLRGIFERGAALGPDADLAARRALVDDFLAVDPAVARLEPDVSVRATEVAGRPAEWLLPGAAHPTARLLYLHGGAWSAGSLRSHRPFLTRLAKAAGIAVLALDYRLAPEHRFPAALEDSVATLDWLRRHGPQGPVEGPAFVAGDSAGGNLALAALLELRGRGARLPDAAVALSPALDFLLTGESYRTRAELDPIIRPRSFKYYKALYLPPDPDLRDPRVSPLYGDPAGLPPLLLQVGDVEVLRDDSTGFAERARAAGVDVTLEVWPGMPHVFQGFGPLLPEAVEATGRIAAFLHRFL